MDTTQLLLTIVLTITTIILVIVGIQLIFVLKELRRILKKTNHIIDAFEKIGFSVEHSFGEIFGFISGIKSILNVVNILHNKKNAKSE